MNEAYTLFADTLMDVFSEVLGLSVGEVNITSGVAPHVDSVSMLRFDGRVSGRLTLAVAPKERHVAAHRFAQCMGMSGADGVLPEPVLFETENIVAGHIMTRLSERGIALVMSPPFRAIDKTPVPNAQSAVISMRILGKQEFVVAFGLELVAVQ